jgi:hypothetical protein
MRRGARIGDGTAGEEAVRGAAGGEVQRVEGSRPPLAAAIRIGTELEEHVDHREVVRAVDDRGRIEREQGRVDHLPEGGLLLEDPAHCVGVAPVKRGGDPLVRGTPLLLDRVDVLPERGPIGEAVLACENELSVAERDALLVGEDGADAVARFGVAGGEGLQQLLRLLLLLREAGSARQGAAER